MFVVDRDDGDTLVVEYQKRKGFVLTKTDMIGVEEAVSFFGNLATAEPGEAWPLRFRALAEEATGDMDTAIKDFTAAIRLDPHDAIACYGRARVELGKKDLDAVISDCTEAIRRNPHDPDGYLVRSEVSLAKEQYGQAVADCARRDSHRSAECPRISAACEGTLVYVRLEQGDR